MMRYRLRVMISFDVVALFTLIPVHRAIEIARNNLEKDESLDNRTSLTVNAICKLLEFRLIKCDIIILQRGVLSINMEQQWAPRFQLA